MVVPSLSCVWRFVTPIDCSMPVCQAPLSCTVSQSLLKFMSTESVMLSNHLNLCCSVLLLLSTFPSIRIFSNQWLFILSMGFSRQEYWNGLLFPFSLDHVLSEVFIMTCPGWPCTAWLRQLLIWGDFWIISPKAGISSVFWVALYFFLCN